MNRKGDPNDCPFCGASLKRASTTLAGSRWFCGTYVTYNWKDKTCEWVQSTQCCKAYTIRMDEMEFTV